MNLTRLMALGTLARHGPQHGHQIRRIAEVTNVGEWGGVSVGALYRELRVMERDGLVERIRTEQVGRRPERTVYALTDDGRLELLTLRDRAIRLVDTASDPFGVAFMFAFADEDRDELRGMLRARRDRLAITGRELADDRRRGLAQGHLNPLEAASMRRGEMHIEAEVRWLDEMDKLFAAQDAALTEDVPPGSGGPHGQAVRDTEG
jgi:DNA-binding PadR family transcriptional regulator